MLAKWGDGKYNTEYIFDIILQEGSISYTDYMIGTSTYATKLVDSYWPSVWFYVNLKNKDMNYSTDWYVGSKGDYKKLIDVLFTKDPSEYNRMFTNEENPSVTRNIISSSEAGKKGDDPFKDYVYYWIWDGHRENPQWIRTYKNNSGQVIPLRSF